MRITTSMITRSALQSLQRGMRSVAEAQETVTTGLRVRTVSDDPTAASQVMVTNGSLRALEQYRRNMQNATSRAQAEEGVLDRLNDLMVRAKELAIGQAGDTANASTRQTTKLEVDKLLEAAQSLGNTRFADGFLFGGAYRLATPFPSTTPPFIGVTTPAGTTPTEVSSGQLLVANHDGKEVFLDTGVLGALHQLSQALGANDTAGINAALTAIDGAYDGIQHLVGDIGARSNQLQVMSANLDALETNLKTFRSDLAEADFETSMTELVSRQTAYQAAMLATARVANMNFTDYLR